LRAKLSEKISSNNEAIRFSDEAAESDVAIRQAIRELAIGAPLTWEDAAKWTEVSASGRVSKFQPCLPEDVERELVARDSMDLGDALTALKVWRTTITEKTMN